MKIRTILKSIVITSLLLSAVSCQEKIGGGFTKGESVKFSVGTDAASTKAEYSGEGTSTIERIDWQAGDLIRIYCESVGSPSEKYADYAVTSEITAEDNVSKAHIQSTDGVGLCWGEGAHTFYGVYPSPEEESSVTMSISPYTDGGTKGTVSKSIEGAVVTAKLPATQAVIGGIKVDGVNNTAAPDLKNMLMTAKSAEYSPETGIPEGTVFLSFIPLTTAVQFTITNQTEANLTLTSVSLTSASSALNGPFTVDIDDIDHQPESINLGNTEITYSHIYPYCEYTGSVSDATRTVTINFASPVTLAYNSDPSQSGKLTFTFFLQPCQNFDDLTFKLTKSDNSWMSTRLGYTDGTGVLIPRFKKSTITGVFVPKGAQWTVKYAPDVQPWNQSSDIPIAPMPEVSIDPFVTSWDTGIDEELSLEPKESDVNFIDLGLPSGTLWADRNVGAKSIMDEPTCYGDYYAWSKTETYYEQASSNPPVSVEWKDSYSKGYHQDYGFPYTKYNATDGLKRLELTDDVANIVLGGGAQIPSVAQWNELIANCIITKTKKGENGGYGYVTLTSKINGNSIILPAGGFYSGTVNSNYGNFGVYYMTSELSATDLSSVYATWCGATEDLQCLANYSRFAGMPVRAVKKKPVEYVEIAGLKWATCNVGANTPKDYGWYFSWAGTTGYVRNGSKWVTAQGGSELSGGFSWANTTYNTGGVETSWNKYIPTGKTGYWTGGGSPDNKLSLDLEDDAVRANLGGSWRMPTQADFQTLYEACGGTGASVAPTALPSANPGKGIYWVSSTQAYISDYAGVAGILFCDGTSKLFFVAAGYGVDGNFNDGGFSGRYWSGAVCSNPPSYAYRLGFQYGNVSPENVNGRNQGYPVRPVSD